MDAIGRLGGPTWFRLGDGDLALHVERTRRLRRRARRCRPITADFARRSASRAPAAADERRSGAHPGRDRRGHARLPGLLRAPPLPPAPCARSASRAPTRRGRPGRPRGAGRSRPRRHHHLPVEPVAQHRPDPGHAGLRDARCAAPRAGDRGHAAHRRASASRGRPPRSWANSASASASAVTPSRCATMPA